jgi:hypothetical protein
MGAWPAFDSGMAAALHKNQSPQFVLAHAGRPLEDTPATPALRENRHATRRFAQAPPQPPFPVPARPTG